MKLFKFTILFLGLSLTSEFYAREYTRPEGQAIFDYENAKLKKSGDKKRILPFRLNKAYQNDDTISEERLLDTLIPEVPATLIGTSDNYTEQWITKRNKPALRRNYDDILAGEDRTSPNKKESWKKVEGALLSFQRDYEGGTDLFGIRSSILWSYHRKLDAKYTFDLKLHEWGFIPSVSLNKFDNAGADDDEVDQLIFRLGLWSFFTGPKPLFYTQFLGNLTYATDTEFESEVFAGEFDISLGWQRILGLEKLNIGTYTYLWPSDYKASRDTRLGYQLDFKIHGEFGTVEDAGESEIFEGEFARIGPELKLTVAPIYYDWLSLVIDYGYYFDLRGEAPQNSYFKSALVVSPDKGKTWALQVEYERGGLDVTKEEVEQLTAGFTVKY